MMNKTCRLCSHPEIDAMESDYLAGLSDAEIASKYDVADRSFRQHKQHSKKIKSSESALKQITTSTIPDIDDMNLTSDEVRFLNQMYLRRSVARLHLSCEVSGSVRAEQALNAAIQSLDKMLSAMNFE